MSNETKQSFLDFIEKNDFKRSESMIHGVLIGDKKYIYQVPKNGNIDCRQFYEDYDGIIYESFDGKVNLIPKEKLKFSDHPSRIRPNGIKSFSVKHQLSNFYHENFNFR